MNEEMKEKEFASVRKNVQESGVNIDTEAKQGTVRGCQYETGHW